MFAIDGTGAPGHRHAVAGRDRRVGRVEIDLAAAAGRQQQAIGPDGFHLAGHFVEHINAEATIFGREAELAGGDQIDRHVIFEQLDVGRSLRPRGAASSRFRGR